MPAPAFYDIRCDRNGSSARLTSEAVDLRAPAVAFPSPTLHTAHCPLLTAHCPLPTAHSPLLPPRIRRRDDGADGLLVEALVTLGALEVLEVAADRALGQEASVLGGVDPAEGE